MKLSDLRLNSDNPRLIKDANFKKLCNSIRDFPKMMSIRPIVIDRDNGNLILGGNMRYNALKALHFTEIPDEWVRDASELTEGEKKRFIIEDNVGFGEWNMDILANSWSDLPLTEWGVYLPDDWMKSDTESADAEPQIDRASELNKKWDVKLGDFYRIGKHRLLCGDSTKVEDIARIMREDRAICVFTDPPYGVSIGKKNVMLNTFQKAGRCLTDLDMDDMLPAELGEMLLKAFKLCKTVMDDQCAVFVCSPQGGELGMMMMMMMQNAGLKVRHTINWIKNSPTFSMGRLDYDYQHESILFTWNKSHKRKKEGAFQTTVWAVDKPRANKEHPTMKPIELPTCAILNHTDEGDVVVDIFGGSGTTMVAAENTSRVCRMIELSPIYCAVILQRMTDAFPGIEIKRIP
jgi:DNA modification methylase